MLMKNFMTRLRLFSESIITLTFGLHSIVFHTIGVIIAWKYVYARWPSGLEFLAILVHDLGYLCSSCWFGDDHPKYMVWVDKLLNVDLIEGHSKRYCKLIGREPSMLWLPDKLSHHMLPKSLIKVLSFIDIGHKTRKYHSILDKHNDLFLSMKH